MERRSGSGTNVGPAHICVASGHGSPRATRQDVAVSELEGVRTWLGRSGVPFEFAVASAFREVGFQVLQGIHYQADDPDALGSRDIDVLAVSEQLVSCHPMTRATVIFVIECKTAKQPWLVFRGQTEGGKWEAAGRFAMNHVTQTDVLGALEWEQDPWILRMWPDHGFRLMATWQGDAGLPEATEAIRSKKGISRDPGFDAVRQVISATDGLLAGDPSHLPTIAIPVLVISSPLYRVSYRDGRERVEPTPWERLLWRGHRSAEARAIDVVGCDAIAEYAGQAWAAAEELLPLLRAAALGRRESDLRRAGDDNGGLQRILFSAEAIVGAAQRIAGRVRRGISARFG